ncbi:hypothetical protein [Williamsia sp. CHRR-6]|uniref:hypothetical protein n=1 Tax=Williamsia sp. CHRR-6 TaxID=2835871 RepID=UPI001BD9DF65|nr:hypothetical protein [Williamsia sp. CHRR-6]MBT0567115.1 hypothetical protein [Williamsia sp. CHRR-6]
MIDVANATLRRLSGLPEVGTNTNPSTMTMASATTATPRPGIELMAGLPHRLDTGSCWCAQPAGGWVDRS